MAGFGGLFSNIFQSAPQVAAQQPQSSSLLDTILKGLGGINTKQALGAGLVGLGAMQREEPGYTTEARQFLRNIYTSPQDPFAEGGVWEKGLPLLERQEQAGLNQLQQRYIAGQPAGLRGMGGSEVAGLREGANQMAQNRQALISGLMLDNLDRQMKSAGTVLSEEHQNKLAAALGGLGANLFQQGGSIGASSNPYDMSGQTQGSQSAIQQLLAGLPGIAGMVGPLMGSSSSTGIDAILKLLGISSPSGVGGIVPPTGAGPVAGAPGSGGAIQSLIQGILSGKGAMGTPGVGSLGALASLLGSAGLGFGAGSMAAGPLTNAANSDSPLRWLNPLPALAESLGANNTWLSGTGGAAAGALGGLAVGGPIGSLVGGIGGLVAGLIGGSGTSAVQKAEFRTQDNDSQRDQVYEIGNIGATWLSRYGVSQSTMDSFASQVNSLAANSESPANEQLMISQQLGSILRQQLGSQFDALRPQLRQEFISYMMGNTFTSGNSSYGGGAPQNFISGEWSSAIGL